MVGTRIREYEITTILGKGGMGVVYKARHSLLNVDRAIKILDASILSNTAAQERFVREAKLLSSLHHPNLVQLYEFGKLETGDYFMVMEFIQGETVQQIIQQMRTIPLTEAIKIVQEAAAGLLCAHQNGIIHRDVSPDNLVLSKDTGGNSVTKVIDFGIARTEFDESAHITATDGFVGKARYASPEQCGFLKEGETVDRRTDIYSLGVTLYYMVSGKLPFYSPTPQGYLIKHLKKPKPLLANLSESSHLDLMNRFLAKAMAGKRENRHQSFDEFLEELNRISSVLFPAASTKESTEKVKPGQKAAVSRFARMMIFLGIPALLVILLVGIRSPGVQQMLRKRPDLLVLKGHKLGVVKVVFSPTGELLASTSEDGTVRLWNTFDGKSIGILRGHTTATLYSVFSYDGRYLATSSEDAKICIWSSPDWKLVKVLETHADTPAVLSFSPRDNLLVSAVDETVRLWDPVHGKLLSSFQAPGVRNPQSIDFTPDGRFLATAGEIVHSWRIIGQKAIPDTRDPNPLELDNADAVAFSPDGKFLASAGQMIHVYRVSSTGEREGKAVFDERASFPLKGEARHLFWLDNQNLVFISTSRIGIWGVENSKLRKEISLQTRGDRIESAALSPDSRILATGTFDGLLLLWSMPEGKLLNTFQDHSDVVISVAFSPDGKFLASGSYDETVRLRRVTP